MSSSEPPCLNDDKRDAPLIEFTGKDPDDRDREFLVTVWWDGQGTIAYRSGPFETWGLPFQMDRVDGSG